MEIIRLIAEVRDNGGTEPFNTLPLQLRRSMPDGIRLRSTSMATVDIVWLLRGRDSSSRIISSLIAPLVRGGLLVA
jgi:hypothetical protein